VPVRPDDWQTSVQASVAAYLDAVTAGQEPPVTGISALETMRLLDRIYRTAVILHGRNSAGRPG
jgi:predicted dehydrogenase